MTNKKFTKNTFLEKCPECGSLLIKQINDSGRELEIECEDCGEELIITKEDYEKEDLKGEKEK